MLRKDLEITDHQNRPTGELHPPGEVWTVLTNEPWQVKLAQQVF